MILAQQIKEHLVQAAKNSQETGPIIANSNMCVRVLTDLIEK